MPASLRAHGPRGTSRPYDRRSPARLLAQPEILASPVSPPSLIHPFDTAEDDPDDEDDTDGGEPTTPADQPGLPTYAAYKRIEADYIAGLSPRKRDKALITQAMFDKIWDVLHQPDACTVDTPQFRFWVRKMFTLVKPTSSTSGDPDDSDSDAEAMGIGYNDDDAWGQDVIAVVLHENRPVAIREQLYELFCYCHVRAGHGGRDKTCAVIRQHYSWVPKELTAQFVKACPTCVSKRSGHGTLGGGATGVGLGMGVDIDMVLVHRPPPVGKREGKLRGRVPEEVGVVVSVPSPLRRARAPWPTTGGPLDPANPGPKSPPSSFAGKSSSRAITESLHRSPGTTGTQEERSLASAMDDDGSLDENPGPDAAAEGCLPPALRPLRLLGPLPTANPEESESDPGPLLASRSSSQLLQIDPVLLSFSYPGLISTGPCHEPGLGVQLIPALSMSASSDMLFNTYMLPGVSTGLHGRLRGPEGDMERVDNAAHCEPRPTGIPPGLTLLSSETRRRHAHGSLAMLLPCSPSDAKLEQDRFPEGIL